MNAYESYPSTEDEASYAVQRIEMISSLAPEGHDVIGKLKENDHLRLLTASDIQSFEATSLPGRMLIRLKDEACEPSTAVIAVSAGAVLAFAASLVVRHKKKK